MEATAERERYTMKRRYEIDTDTTRASPSNAAFRSIAREGDAERAREPAKPRQFVDFSFVPPSQWKIHDRLLAWARWCDSRPAQNTAAGFELFRSGDARRDYGTPTTVPLNKDDCQVIATAVAGLPQRNRQAVQWLYLNGRDPLGNAVKLGLDRQGLMDLIVEGRGMLVESRI